MALTRTGDISKPTDNKHARYAMGVLKFKDTTFRFFIIVF